MNRSARFRLNAPRVIHELFEHEVVVVNLDTGRYYCLQSSGVDLWNGLMAGASVEEIVRAFQTAYPGDGAEIETGVVATVADLAREELIAEAPTLGPSAEAWQPRSGTTFERPTLQTYTDMQDLLLLDPIHEVDEAGWPIAADPTKGPADIGR